MVEVTATVTIQTDEFRFVRPVRGFEMIRDAGTAYAAILVAGDVRPHLYRTTDYGQDWQEITNGLANDGTMRVVREVDRLFAVQWRGRQSPKREQI